MSSGRRSAEGNLSPRDIVTTDNFDATTVDHTTVTLGDASETHVDKKTGLAKRHEEDVDGDGDTDLVFHFRFNETGLPCNPDVVPFNGATYDGQAITAGGSDAALVRDFPIGQDWTGTESLSFWYRGAGGGEEITVTLKDNRAPDPGPSGWTLAWSDEFDGPAGAPPDPANWSYEIGDGTVNGIPGWGNSELQYYTDDPANSSTDGSGNLVITLDEADPSLECYYGPCEYASARLITHHKAEFAYGRIESRLRVPDGGDGLWPAFWSLGTDITYNPWPAAGEIDFMEYVSRLPNEIFGTIHGPGYNGGNAFGDIYDFGEPVYNNYHTFTVEWEPNLITWYVDGIQYHQAEPSDVPGAVGVREAVLPVAQLRHRWQLRWPGRSREHVPAGVPGRLRPGLSGSRYRRAVRGHLHRQLDGLAAGVDPDDRLRPQRRPTGRRPERRARPRRGLGLRLGLPQRHGQR